MSSAGERSRKVTCDILIPGWRSQKGVLPSQRKSFGKGAQFTVSESHRKNRKTGSYDAGGPFFTSLVEPFIEPTQVTDIYRLGSPDYWYSGPVFDQLPSTSDMEKAGYKNKFLSLDKSQDLSTAESFGATAISNTAPTNSASDLGTGLAELTREGFPSIPGIQAWRRKTEVAKTASGEYLNQVFGWLPMISEVTQARDVASQSKKIMKNYHRGEGGNTHRRFTFPTITENLTSISAGGNWPLAGGLDTGFVAGTPPATNLSVSRQTKRWFEGCYTYKLPSDSDSWKKAMYAGDQADHLYGLQLTPQVLWELTPWSWAIDWFSNTGDVINNAYQFGAAGLVLRYGYMMEETIETITKETAPTKFRTKDPVTKKEGTKMSGICKCGYKTITKRRAPANPFGFSVGWEDLSPTQLAITAALGISKFG